MKQPIPNNIKKIKLLNDLIDLNMKTDDDLEHLENTIKKEIEKRENEYTTAEIVDVQTASAILNVGRNFLFSVLKFNKVIMSNNLPYSQYIKLNYFVVKSRKYYVNGHEKIQFKTMVTLKGIEFIKTKILIKY